jgi:hypothetical protein
MITRYAQFDWEIYQHTTHDLGVLDSFSAFSDDPTFQHATQLVMRYLSYQGDQVKFIRFCGTGSEDSDKITEKFMMRETEENREKKAKSQS